MFTLPTRLTRTLVLLAGTMGALAVVPVLVLGNAPATVIGWT